MAKKELKCHSRWTRMNIQPVYQSFTGWNTDTTAIQNAADLPPAMSTYIDFINSYIGAPVKYISNGPGREQILCCK